MSVIQVAFQPQIYRDPISRELNILYQPKIQIFIKVNGTLYPFKLEPHIDSGATRNLFPADPLDSLNIQLENDRKKVHFGIGGVEVASYTHDVEILINNYSFTTEVDFSREHKPPLLGIEGFFRYFEYVNFNMREKQLELTTFSKRSKLN